MSSSATLTPPLVERPSWAEGEAEEHACGPLWPYTARYQCGHACPRTAYARSDEEYDRDVAEASRRHCPDLCVVGGGCACEGCEKRRAAVARGRREGTL